MADIQKPDMAKLWANAGDKTPPADSLINSGWNAGDIPANTDFNFIDARQDQGVAYMLQKGIPEWDSVTEYQANKSWVQYGGKIYKCIQTSSNKQPDTQITYWRLDKQQVTSGDYASLADMFAANTSGVVTILPGTYTLSTKISVTLTGNLTVFAYGVTINSTIPDNTAGAMLDFDGGNLYRAEVVGLTGAATGSGSNSLSGIRFYRCVGPYAARNKITGFANHGIFADECSDVFYFRNFAQGNRVSGLYITNSNGMEVLYNQLGPNGVIGAGNGYSMSLGTSISVANKKAVVSGNIGVDPVRKFIDIHSGNGVIISNNILRNATGLQDTSSAGIYALSESTTKDVRNVMVIDNDLDGTGCGNSALGIQVGYKNDGAATAPNPETVVVSRNVVRNFNGANSSDIVVNIAASPALPLDSIVVKDNVLRSAAGAGSAVFVENVNNPPISVEISNNDIYRVSTGAILRCEFGVNYKAVGNRINVPSGTASSAIFAPSGATNVTVDGNQLIGTFTTPISAKSTGTINTLNGVKLPSVVFNGAYESGSLRAATKQFYTATAGAAVTLDICVANLPTSSDSSVLVDVRIVECKNSNNAKTVFKASAYAYNNAGTFTGINGTVTADMTIVAGAVTPTLTWVNVSGTTGTLRLTLNTTFAASIIDVLAVGARSGSTVTLL